MRLNMPVIETPESEPFKNALFFRKEFADFLFNLLQNIEDGGAICIDAAWGDGKTVFAKGFKLYLKNKGYESIYFDSFEYEYVDNPFHLFINVITNMLKKLFPNNIEIKKASDTLKRVGKNILKCIGKKVYDKTLGQQISLEDLIDIFKKEGKPKNLKIIEYEEYQKMKNDFIITLKNVGNKVKNNIESDKKPFPLVIMIDELDRCRPEYALSLLEVLKYYFTVDNIVFIVLLNKEQLINYVSHIYGSNIDGNRYLDKFLSITLSLPKGRENNEDGNLDEFIKRLMIKYGINLSDGIFKNNAIFIFTLLGVSLREIERSILIYALYSTNNNGMGRDEKILVIFLIAVRIVKRSIYNRIKKMEVSFDEINNEIRIESIEKENNDPWNDIRTNIITVLKYILEKNVVADQDEIPGHFINYSRNKNKILIDIIRQLEVIGSV